MTTMVSSAPLACYSFYCHRVLFVAMPDVVAQRLLEKLYISYLLVPEKKERKINFPWEINIETQTKVISNRLLERSKSVKVIRLSGLLNQTIPKALERTSIGIVPKNT